MGYFYALRAHGPKRTLKMMLTLSQPKVGKLVGTDAQGNEYYENRNEINFRDRWVLYSKWNFDASQIPVEWHAWMTHMTDQVPSESRPFFSPSAWNENLTGTFGAFKTYSTVVPKISSWNPRVLERKSK